MPPVGELSPLSFLGLQLVLDVVFAFFPIECIIRIVRFSIIIIIDIDFVSKCSGGGIEYQPNSAPVSSYLSMVAGRRSSFEVPVSVEELSPWLRTPGRKPLDHSTRFFQHLV
uniref:Uncharacterized protein n=1 Tax=Anopheles farauti TaxID=69004 RepID=A0A182Q338_9DIPT